MWVRMRAWLCACHGFQGVLGSATARGTSNSFTSAPGTCGAAPASHLRGGSDI